MTIDHLAMVSEITRWLTYGIGATFSIYVGYLGILAGLRVFSRFFRWNQ